MRQAFKIRLQRALGRSIGGVPAAAASRRNTTESGNNTAVILEAR